MQLKLLSPDDCQALLEFETQNKAHFEANVPPRPDGYFTHDSLLKIIKTLCQEQANGECFLYLIYQNNKLIARANLVNIQNQSAELGYRLAKQATGQGQATKIVANLIKRAKTTHALTQINAHTTTNNPASIRVLEKNNFKHLKFQKNAAKLNGKSLDFTYFTLNL